MPRHEGEPDYEAIKNRHDIAKANASSVTSSLGGGAHGLLGLTLILATYQNFTGHPFVRAPDPGHVPTIPSNSTAAQISVAVHQYE